MKSKIVANVAPVAAYVRADVAAEQTAAALRGEAHEVTALRAEVEALRARLETASLVGVAPAAYEAMRARAEMEAQRAGRMRAFLDRLARGDVWNHKLDADYIRQCDDALIADAAAKGVG